MFEFCNEPPMPDPVEGNALFTKYANFFAFVQGPTNCIVQNLRVDLQWNSLMGSQIERNNRTILKQKVMYMFMDILFPEFYRENYGVILSIISVKDL